jgi:acyl transferase domain-containing protein
MLSPSSRSKMWDMQADGYARGDGFAVVILKKLSQAIKDQDDIMSVIRETMVNSDGRTAGITMPCAPAQATLIRQTYQRAGLDCYQKADRCQYFEAHGPGTPTGDPIEAEAIRNAFFPEGRESKPVGGDISDEYLYVGSIKTIIGHLEGCAGLAGLLKASLAVHNSIIPPNLHFETLNPAIEPFYAHLKIPTVAQPWPDITPGSARRVSVNSFGFGGTK